MCHDIILCVCVWTPCVPAHSKHLTTESLSRTEGSFPAKRVTLYWLWQGPIYGTPGLISSESVHVFAQQDSYRTEWIVHRDSMTLLTPYVSSSWILWSQNLARNFDLSTTTQKCMQMPNLALKNHGKDNFPLHWKKIAFSVRRMSVRNFHFLHTFWAQNSGRSISSKICIFWAHNFYF